MARRSANVLIRRNMKKLLWKISPDLFKYLKNFYVLFIKKTDYCVGLTEEWRRFHRENYSEITRHMDRLKYGLDSRSCEVIDTIWYRQTELLPRSEDLSKFRFDHRGILTKDEWNDIEFPRYEDQIRREFSIPGDFYLETTVFRYHHGLKFVPDETIRSLAGKDFIDGGASWGDLSLILTKYSPRRVYAFEPTPDSYARLVQMVTGNNLQGTIIPLNMGIFDKKASSMTLTVQKTREDAGNLFGKIVRTAGNTMPGEDVRAVEVKVTTVDEVVSSNNLDLGLIKFDIEGSELNGIRGGVESIKKFRPVLLISIYHRPEDFFFIKPLLEDLHLGYRFSIRKLEPESFVNEVALIAY